MEHVKNTLKGNAKGNKLALYLRSFLQWLLFRLGCFIQKHSLVVLLIGLLILITFSVGLLDATIETDLEKLWVEKRGRLNEERRYLSEAFRKYNLRDISSNETKKADRSADLLGGSESEQFLMLIQTPGRPKMKLNGKDFLLHEKALSSIAQLKIYLFNETWDLRDICFRPSAPKLPEGLEPLVGDLLETFIPCIIITPLDCFWEGSKPNGPFPPYELEGLITFLGSLTDSYLSWKNLDPRKVLDEVNQFLLSPAIQSITSLFERAGISHGYMRRPCLEPLDPECPESAPNHVDFCSLVNKVLAYNKEHKNFYKLIDDHNAIQNQTAASFESLEPSYGCKNFDEKVRRLLLSDKQIYNKFVPQVVNVDVNKQLSGGCRGFAENYMRWPDDLIIGGVKKDGRKISGPWSLSVAKEVLAAWQRHFTDFIYYYELNSDRARICHPLAGTSANDMLKEFSKFNPTVIIIGYLFMIFYASLSLCSFSGKGANSGVGLGLAGCLLVTLAGTGGLGCSMFFGIPFNAATTQIVPFLTLRLGVDDMFLLVHNYRDVVRLAKRDEIGFLLKETGLSALLTSINNILAFLAGGLMPVPALRDFCIQVALLLTFNAVSILTIYPAIMSFDLRRRRNHRVDLFCCFKVAPVNSSNSKKSPPEKLQTELTNRAAIEAVGDTVERRHESVPVSGVYHNGSGNMNNGPKIASPYSHSRTNSEIAAGDAINLSIGARSTSRSFLTTPNDLCPNDEGRSSALGASGDTTINASVHYDCSPRHWTLHRFVDDYYNRWLSKMPVKVILVIGVLCLNLAIFLFGIIFCSKVTLGLELTDVIPKGTAAYAFLDARETYFSFYPFNAIVKGPIDLPSKQMLMREYREALSNVSYVVKREAKVQEQFWLDLMRIWLQNLQEHLDKDMKDAKIQYDPETGAGVDNGASGESLLAFQLLCNAGTEIDCSRVNTTRLIDDAGLIMQDGFYNYLTAWVNHDPMTYHVSRAAFVPKPVRWHSTFVIDNISDLAVPQAENLLSSRIPFFLNGLVDTPAIVDMIEKVRAVCDEFSAKGLPTFPEGIPFTFWEQYLHLRWNLLLALSIVIGSMFVVISLLLVNPWTSTIVVFVLIVLVVELAGFMGAVGLKLNAVSAVSLITAVGIGVEFTVHLSLSFLTTLGTRNQRMTATLSNMFIPVLHGGLSTLLGVIMLALSQFEFIVRYFFMVMSALIVLGLLNGLVLLPVLLSLVGPVSEVRTIDESHYLPPPSPPPSYQTAPKKQGV